MMALKKEEQIELSNLLSSIELDKVTKFPVANIPNVPIAYMNYEVVFKSKDKFMGFSIEDAIKESNHAQTVTILDKNGMHFYYTKTQVKQMLWIPNVYDTIKDVEGTVVVMQEFPQDGECVTRYIKAQDINDDSIKEFLDKDVLIFNNADFYIQKSSLENLSKICNTLWSQDMLKNKSGLSTLQYS